MFGKGFSISVSFEDLDAVFWIGLWGRIWAYMSKFTNAFYTAFYTWHIMASLAPNRSLHSPLVQLDRNKTMVLAGIET